METSPKRDTGAVPKSASPPTKPRSSSTGSPGSKLGPFRLKKGSSSPEMKEEKEKKKSKKSKGKNKANKELEAPSESDKPEAEQQQQENISPGATPPIVKQSKSKASSLVRKLSIGKYKNKTPKSSQSPSPTLEGSPAQSKSDLTVEEDRFSTASSSTGGRFGEDGAGGGGGNSDAIAVTSSFPTSPASPPVADKEGGGNDVSEPGGAYTSTEERVAGENGEPTTSGDSSAPVEDRFLKRQAWLTQNLDKTLTASEAEAIENAAVTPLSTKDQILSITTPLVEKQREEVAEIQKFIEQESGGSAVLSNIEEEGRLETSEEAVEEGNKELTATMPAASNTTEGDTVPPRLSQSLGPSMAQQVGEKREHLYKILVIGELGTGKTSIIKRYVHQFFSQHYRATIGVDFALKVLNWDANTIIRLQLWDIAGQERFGNMTRVYYKEAVGAFIVFDVTRAATFEAVVKWKQDLDAKVQLADGSPIPCILLANKCDQQKEGLVNNPTKMDEYCKERGFAAWFETSAKENINIEDAAQCLVNKILQNDKLIHHSESSKDLDKIALDGKNQRDQKNGKTCAC